VVVVQSHALLHVVEHQVESVVAASFSAAVAAVVVVAAAAPGAAFVIAAVATADVVVTQAERIKEVGAGPGDPLQSRAHLAADLLVMALTSGPDLLVAAGS